MTSDNRQNKAESSAMDICQWTVKEVLAFLHEHTGLTQYDESFESNDINGSNLLSISSEELKNDLGIQSLGHRKQILQNIQKYGMFLCIQTKTKRNNTKYTNTD